MKGAASVMVCTALLLSARRYFKRRARLRELPNGHPLPNGTAVNHASVSDRLLLLSITVAFNKKVFFLWLLFVTQLSRDFMYNSCLPCVYVCECVDVHVYMCVHFVYLNDYMCLNGQIRCLRTSLFTTLNSQPTYQCGMESHSGLI